MSETATASFKATQLNASTFEYTITLSDTGTTTIGTFWFAWDDVPDQNFMHTSPGLVQSPAGWASTVTHGGTSDGYGIRWTAASAGNFLQPGDTVNAFSFTSGETPAALAAISQIDPSFATTSSFVYLAGAEQDPGFNFVVAPACFRAGTLITTARGEVAVEDLRHDDAIVAADGTLRPLVWLGRRRIDCKRHRAPHQVWPIRIARDAIADAQPAWDLYLSPDHAVFLDDVLIPAKHLVNDSTITQVPVDEVSYFHVALDRHAVLLAEGLPVESYLETGDRAAFENGNAPIVLHPDFAVRIWEAAGCAPLVVAGARLAAIRKRLTQRAMSLGRRGAAVV